MRYFCFIFLFITLAASVEAESGNRGSVDRESVDSELIPVNVDNYAEAKTALHFQRVLKRAGDVNQFLHLRGPTPLDQQRVTRMNRDTLYSSAIVDISKGATLYLPDAGKRYLSAMVVNEQNYINGILHDKGAHQLDTSKYGSDFVMVVVRIFANANDPKDVKIANNLQALLQIKSASDRPYTPKPFDPASLKKATGALMELGGQLPDATKTFGTKSHVDPVRHILGAAYGWGGLPESEVVYMNVQPNLPLGAYKLSVSDVPVDGFWSISVYNKEGYFQENEAGAYSVNNYTAKANKDGSFSIHFGGEPTKSNFLPITEGWNYVVRMYRPHQSVIDGSWVFPEIEVHK